MEYSKFADDADEEIKIQNRSEAEKYCRLSRNGGRSHRNRRNRESFKVPSLRASTNTESLNTQSLPMMPMKKSKPKIDLRRRTLQQLQPNFNDTMVSPSKLPPPTAPSAQSSSSVATASSAPTFSSRRSKVPKSEEFKSELERQGVTILDDRFELQEYINGGRHGVVYKGIDNLSGNSVAIKIALPMDKQTAFEVKVLSRLGMSKFTPDLLYTGLGQRPHPFIILSEEGKHLKDLQKPFLDLGVGLDLPRVLLVVHDVVQGLQYLHSKGVVHRDLHPKNLLVSKTHGKSQILLCDFGLSGIRQPDGSFICQSDTSLLQRVFSTPYFVRKGSPHNEADDLYSVVYLTLMLRASKLADVPTKKLQEMKKSLIYDMLETLPEEEEIFADFFATVFAQDRTALPNHSAVLATIKAIDGFNENLDIHLPDPLPSPLTIESLAARTRQ